MERLYSTETFIQTSAKIDKVCEWLSSVGINYSKTRIQNYKQIFEFLAKCQLGGSVESFHEKYTIKEFVNAAYEIADLERIYEGLNSLQDSEMKGRLRNAVKGHNLYVMDTHNRSGRDITFELVVAAKFARPNYRIDFGDDADVKVQIGGTPFFIECKRLKSCKKVRKRIKEGLKQLHRRYGASGYPNEARGMLALSIGKTVNPKLGLIEASSQAELGEKASAYNKEFINNYGKLWHTCKDPRTLGAAIFFDVPGMLMPQQRVERCHEVMFNNAVPEGTDGYHFLFDTVGSVFHGWN